MSAARTMALLGSSRTRCDACSMPLAFRNPHIDGLCLSSFTLHPDTAVAFTQHVGLSPRMLEWLPMGGACGVIALRRAARAIQAGDAEIVACIAGDTANETSFRDLLATFSSFSRDAVYPYGAGGPNASFALIADAYMRATGATREDFGKLAVAQRANARRNPLALLRGELTLQQYLAARPIAEPHALVRLRHALRRRRRLPGDAGSARPCTATAVPARAGRNRAPQRLSRRSGAIARRLGDGSRCAVAAGKHRSGRCAGCGNLRRLCRHFDAAIRRPGPVSAGRGARLRAPARLHHRGQRAAQYRRRPVVHGAGRRRGRLSWAGGGDAAVARAGRRAPGRRTRSQRWSAASA